MTRAFFLKTMTALLVGVFAFGYATPAEAKFTLSITDLNASGSKSFSTTGGSINQTFDYHGYHFVIDATSTRPGQGPTDPAVITVHSVVTANGAPSQTARFNIIAQDNFVAPGTTGSNVQLWGTLQTGQVDAGITVTTRAQYQPSSGGNPIGGAASIVKSSTLSVTGPTAGTPEFASAKKAIVRTSPQFTLTGVEFDLETTGVGTADFTGRSIVALPAPASIIMALFGVPPFFAMAWGRKKFWSRSKAPVAL